MKMKYKLLLTSGGIVPEIRKEFLSLLPKKKPADNRVAFITTAAYGENKEPHWLMKDRLLVEACGINNIEEIDLREREGTPQELEKKLTDKDIIVVNGGNTFYLLDWTRKSNFDKVVEKFLQKGGLYVGVSAGSYLACPTIEQATWKRADRDRWGVTDFKALNLIHFLIVAHFEEKYRTIIDSAAKTTKYPIVALTDKQAIVVDGKKVRIVGVGNKEFWNGFKGLKNRA